MTSEQFHVEIRLLEIVTVGGYEGFSDVSNQFVDTFIKTYDSRLPVSLYTFTPSPSGRMESTLGKPQVKTI